MGLTPVAIPGAERTAIGVIGNQGWVDDSALRGNKAIQEIIHVTKPYKLVSRDFHPRDSVVTLGGTVKVGGASPFLMIAGPCAVESRDQLMKTALFLKKSGVRVLRGGAYKPRTSPHSFQGLREGGLDLLDEVRKKSGLLVVYRESGMRSVAGVDILQIGRNMQNFDLLTESGKSGSRSSDAASRRQSRNGLRPRNISLSTAIRTWSCANGAYGRSRPRRGTRRTSPLSPWSGR
jgi:3-deoxy-7-phosphoheptulonate synthase